MSPPVKLYDHRGIVLYWGHCGAVLAGLPGKSVDHVISDPPYETEAHTLQRRVKTSDGARVVEMPLSFVPMDDETRALCGREWNRLVKRWMLVFCQVEAVMVWADALEIHARRDVLTKGLRYIRTCVWVKSDAMPQLTGDRPGMGFETIVTMHGPGASKWNGRGRDGNFVHTRERDRNRFHETQKPIALMRELVHLFTDEGDLVLDPFCGSATTLVACRTLNRRAIGVELDLEMAKKAARRLEDMDRQGEIWTAVRSGTDGASSMHDDDRASEEPFHFVEKLSDSSPTAHKLDMLGAFHRCDALDGRPYLYLPALDPSAEDLPGGAKVRERFNPTTCPAFDYDPKIEGACWICAYGERVRLGTTTMFDVQPEPRRVSLRDRLRELGIIAKAAVAEVRAERRAEERAEAEPVPTPSAPSSMVSTGNAVIDDLGFHGYERAVAPSSASSASSVASNTQADSIVVPKPPGNRQVRLL